MGLSKIKWHDFGKQENCDDLIDYFYNRQYEHGKYYHYTSLKNINNILGDNKFVFWLSKVSGFNDRPDKEQFEGNEREYYSLCFSTGVNENLPLWYFYSGVDGCGGRIGLEKKYISDFVNNSEYALCTVEEQGDDKQPSIKEKVLVLAPDKTMDMEFKDIIYLRRNGNENKLSIKYNTMTNYNIHSSEYDKIHKNWQHFIKGLIWYYEKETRLLVHLKGEAANKVKNNNEKYVVTLSVPESIRSKIKIDLAPNIRDIDTALKNYSNIRDFNDSTKNKRVALSKYNGEIEIDLCKNCSFKK